VSIFFFALLVLQLSDSLMANLCVLKSSSLFQVIWVRIIVFFFVEDFAFMAQVES